MFGRTERCGLYCAVFVYAAITLDAVARGQNCNGYWSNLFPSGRLSADVVAMTSFDPDGGGPEHEQLAVATIAEVRLWNGRTWRRIAGYQSPLGSGSDAGFRALAAFDPDGAGPARAVLVVAGTFTAVDAVPANRIAYWDGGSWRSIGTGFNGKVNALLSFDADGDGPGAPQLVAGGEFTLAGVAAVNRIATTSDLATWSPLGAGLNAPVLALCAHAPDGSGAARLMAGGSFTGSGTTSINRIATWTGAAWASVGPSAGANGPVRALASFDADDTGAAPALLIAGGSFTSIGGVSTPYLASWNGAAWGGIPGSLDGEVRGLAVCPGGSRLPGSATLAVGGAFQNVAGTVQPGVAFWSGTSWLEPSSPTLAGGCAVDVIATARLPDPAGDAPRIFAAGAQLKLPTSAPDQSPELAQWTPMGWTMLSRGVGSSIYGGQDGIYAMTMHDEDGPGPAPAVLIVAGNFKAVGSLPCQNIARLVGTQWSCVGPGLALYEFDGEIRAVASFDPDGDGPDPPLLVAGGYFTRVNGRTARHLAVWDGVSWAEFGGGASYPVNSLVVYDPDGEGPLNPRLLAGGGFDSIGGVAASGVAEWNGTAWSPFGGGTGGSVRALMRWDSDGPGPVAPAVVASVSIPQKIVKWTGEDWVPVSPSSQFAYTLCEFDPDGPGPALPGLYRGWNDVRLLTGETWTVIGDQFSLAPIFRLAVFDDDGAGADPPALYAAGSIRHPTPTLPPRPGQRGGVAQWNGSAWVGLGDPIWIRTIGPAYPQGVFDVVAHDPDGPGGPAPPRLYAGGRFGWVSGDLAANFAVWVGCSSGSCAGDVNGDGLVDASDLDALLRTYGAWTLPGSDGDLDSSGVVDQPDLDIVLYHYGDVCG